MNKYVIVESFAPMLAKVGDYNIFGLFNVEVFPASETDRKVIKVRSGYFDFNFAEEDEIPFTYYLPAKSADPQPKDNLWLKVMYYSTFGWRQNLTSSSPKRGSLTEYSGMAKKVNGNFGVIELRSSSQSPNTYPYDYEDMEKVAIYRI